MYNVNQIADYIIFRLTSEDQFGLVNLKLQKLLYYSQAWHLTFTGKTLFDGKFQAWIHGPVNREVYDRFKSTKFLYSSITPSDIQDQSWITKIDNESKIHIDNVLETYASFSAVELELMTHREEPWQKARE